MKIQINAYPTDAPYGNGTIHYFNIVDKGERPTNLPIDTSWSRYEADYEIVGDIAENTDKAITKSLFRKYLTLDLIEQEIEQMNLLLGYPDNKGTSTYAQIPELTEIKQVNENGVETVVDSFYLLPITDYLQESGLSGIPVVSVEVLNGNWVITDTVIKGETLEGLDGNVRDYSIQVPVEALYDSEMEVIETLLGDNNTLGDGI